jgi:hypothetical protein
LEVIVSTAPGLTGERGGVSVDSEKMVRFLDARIARTASERHKRNLQTVRDHMYYEKMLDPDSVMKTLSPRANYKLWVDGVDKGPKGFGAIREWYVDQNIRRQRTFVIQYDLERVVVDDDVVVTEGQMNVVVEGRYATRFFNVKCEPDDVLLQSFRQVVFWPVDENSKLLGEDFYTSGMGREGAFRKLERHEIPDDWYALVKLSQEI